MRIPLLVALTAASLCAQSAKPYVSKVWVADRGDGTYRNPILYADYSDPDAIRVGEDYYLVASSFDAVPGLPILHSKDLVNWEILTHVYARQPPYDVYSTTQHGWALRHSRQRRRRERLRRLRLVPHRPGGQSIGLPGRIAARVTITYLFMWVIRDSPAVPLTDFDGSISSEAR